MKQSRNEVGDVMKNKLEGETPSISFENVWGKHIKTQGYIFGYRKAFAIPVIALLLIITLVTGGFASNQINRIIDKTDYSFVDDLQVLGKWETVDFVRNIDDFSAGKVSWQGEKFLKAIAFIKYGSLLMALENGNLAPMPCTWTKGLIIDKQEQTASKYIIKEIDGSTYLFFEWKSGDYSFRGMTPYYYVLKKTDNMDYSNYQVERKVDKIDYPFVDDPQIVGKWLSVDFVGKIEDFKVDQKSWRGDLYLKELNITNNGKFIDAPWWTWTNGIIMHSGDKTASKYVIKEIDGNKYMFFEWKSGDYIFRGRQPEYYVLKKVG